MSWWLGKNLGVKEENKWWLGKNVGVKEGGWKKLGKKLGIGLSEEESWKRRGLKTPEEQAQMAYENRDRAPGVAQNTARGLLGLMAKGDQESAGRITAKPSVKKNKQASEWTNEEVFSLQQMLNRAGYTDSGGDALAEDGMLGAKTVSALRKYQGDKSGGGQQGPRMEDGGFSDSRDQEQLNYGVADAKRNRMEDAGFKMPPSGDEAWGDWGDR